MKELLSTAGLVIMGAVAYIAIALLGLGAPVYAVCMVLSWFGVI